MLWKHRIEFGKLTFPLSFIHRHHWFSANKPKLGPNLYILLSFSFIVFFSSSNEHTLFLVVGTTIISSDIFSPLTAPWGVLGQLYITGK